MKLMLASDIHGSAFWCEKLLDAFKNENADRLFLLGDILYHGPRNDLPQDYAPKKIIPMLNELKNKIFCIRGNCDTEVDQMVLDFPILADYSVLNFGDSIIYATHGHKFGKDNPPPLTKGDILICGHTHVPTAINTGDYIYLNTGSVSIPKENSPHSYVVFENNTFTWKNLENGDVFFTYSI